MPKGASKRKAEPESEAKDCSENKKSKPCDNDKEAQLLGVMLEYHMNEDGAINFAKFASDLGIHKGNKAFGAAWKASKENGTIEEFEKGYVISKKGIAQASTPEYKEFLKDKNFVAQNNDEYQERIKKKLSETGLKIFDLLQKHGPLSRYALAGMLRSKPGSKTFFYAEQNLRKKGYIEQDPQDKKKKRLSNKAFRTPEDRPVPVHLDAKVLAEAIRYATTKNKDSNDDSKDSKESATKSTKAQGKDEVANRKRFAKKHRAQVKEDNPAMGKSEVRKKLLEMWRDLSDEEKEEFQMSEDAKDANSDKEPDDTTVESTKNEPKQESDEEVKQEEDKDASNRKDTADTVKKEDIKTEAEETTEDKSSVEEEPTKNDDTGEGDRELVDSTKKEAVKSDVTSIKDKALDDMGDVGEEIKKQDVDDCCNLLDIDMPDQVVEDTKS